MPEAQSTAADLTPDLPGIHLPSTGPQKWQYQQSTAAKTVQVPCPLPGDHKTLMSHVSSNSHTYPAGYAILRENYLLCA